MHWLTHVLGLDNPSGRWYLWWSGFGGDASKVAAIGWLAREWRRHHHHG